MPSAYWFGISKVALSITRWGSYPRILGRYVREEKILTLPQAIHKMTGAPAKRVGLRERGLLQQGYFADITVFDPQRVIDKATFGFVCS